MRWACARSPIITTTAAWTDVTVTTARTQLHLRCFDRASSSSTPPIRHPTSAPADSPRTNSSHCNGVRHESAPRGHPYGMSSPHGVPGNYEVGPHMRYKCYTPPGEILRDSQKNLSDYPPDALYNPEAAPYQRSFATQMSYEWRLDETKSSPFCTTFRSSCNPQKYSIESVF